MKWHTKEEKRIIRQLGGVPLTKYGYDGKLNGQPVEVRSARKDNRYRIQKDTHQHLVQNEGSYIFVRGSKAKRVSAKRVSEMIGKGKWYKDRKYPHKFARVRQVF